MRFTPTISISPGACAGVLFLFFLLGCEQPTPDTDCEVAEHCALIVTGDKCSEATRCGCDPTTVPGNQRSQEEFQRRFDEAICLPTMCLARPMCAIREPRLFCHEGQCGVVFDDEAPPEGADVLEG